MNQRGFIQFTPLGWVLIGLGIVVVGLVIALQVQSARLEREQEAHAITTAAYQTFKAGVKLLGDEAKAKTEAEIKRQEQVNQERSAGYEKRIAAINESYRRLRDNRVGSRGRELSAIPDTARPADDAARDSRLLEVLRAADEQTARLIELQRWVSEQGKVTP